MQWGKIGPALSILLFCSAGQAQYTFILADNDGTTDAVELTAGETFTIEVQLEAGGPLIGFSYMLTISDQANGLLSINEALVPETVAFEDPITLPEEFVGMVLDPTTDRDLGLLNDQVDVNEPADNYHVRTVTLATEPDLPAGEYTLTATGTIITIYDPGSLFVEEEANALPYTLTVVAEGGGDDGSSGGSTPPPPSNTAPDPEFTLAPATGEAPLTVYFDASATTDAEGDTLTFSWDYGDGSVGEGPVVEHTFSQAGDYQVILTVDDGAGGIEIAAESVSVSEPPPADDDGSTNGGDQNTGETPTDNQDDTTGDDETGDSETNDGSGDTVDDGSTDATDDQVPAPPACGAGATMPLAMCGVFGLFSMERRRRKVGY
jgi:hypothetical protein